MKYVRNCAATLLFCLIAYFSVLSSIAAAASTTAAADGFLKRLLSAEQHGMGGSFVGTSHGANALGSNPAGISAAAGNRFVIHATRFPRTIALLSKPNQNANYEDYSRYEQRAYGIETLNYAFPMGKFGAIGLGLAFEQAGPFRRVDHSGKALNSFPGNNLAIGFSYGLKLFGGTRVGLDTKWLRSKVSDADGTEHLGHGYAYNIGISQRIGDRTLVGIVARNLSNGLSFSEPSIPDTMARTIVAGISHRYAISDVTLRVGLDVHPPFSDGIRANVGGEVWYRHRVGARIGYLRHTEKRYAQVFLLEDGAFAAEERLWKAEGFCFGLGVRFGSLILNVAYTPQFRPVAAENERIHIVQGDALYTFSIGRTFSKPMLLF
ncbi:hypothetical protein F4Z99_19635 [Candidatus Poribacteria bacterium]|nr:hypothetical protein [Candidatus Poribacteria bacterium]MYB00485.1 hypothetical protein [Candidatus Poribacteria bacterium]